jgi:DnaJ-class molecular chaperone
MKRILKFIVRLVTCPACYGMGTTELASGDTVECKKCGGKGFI